MLNKKNESIKDSGIIVFGMIGLLCIQALKATGCGELIVSGKMNVYVNWSQGSLLDESANWFDRLYCRCPA